MKAAVMEMRFRLCASPDRFQLFLEQASAAVTAACPARVQHAFFFEETQSLLLSRQWERTNQIEQLSSPHVWEVGFGFWDTTGRLTGEKMEVISKRVLVDLEPVRETNIIESVPWILTLSTKNDKPSRRTISERYPELGLSSLVTAA